MSEGIRWPAEWENHRATWLAWPHNKSDWPSKNGQGVELAQACILEFIRELTVHETVELIAENASETEIYLNKLGLNCSKVQLHQLETDRSWLRDSAPTAIKKNGSLAWLGWKFNAWARYDDFSRDQKVPDFISKITGNELLKPQHGKKSHEVVLEGGAIEGNGAGTVIVTEQCLLGKVQERNPGLFKVDYEQIFEKYLGASKTIWLEAGIPGDDTHGHIDDLARFVSDSAVLLVFDKRDPDFQNLSNRNLKILEQSKTAEGEKLSIELLPLPSPVIAEGELVPASYANFYIGNETVYVPIFKDRVDDKALRIIDDNFPKRNIFPVDCRALIVGCGALHCSAQQEPA